MRTPRSTNRREPPHDAMHVAGPTGCIVRGVRGLEAHDVTRALERVRKHLRESKATMPEDDYYQKLETMAVEMARLYEKASGSPGDAK